MVKEYVDERAYDPVFCHECGLVFYSFLYLENHQKETGHKNGELYEVGRKHKLYWVDRIFRNATEHSVEPEYKKLVRRENINEQGKTVADTDDSE